VRDHARRERSTAIWNVDGHKVYEAHTVDVRGELPGLPCLAQPVSGCLDLRAEKAATSSSASAGSCWISAVIARW
jgi:hypothetical protein